jgi:hypothetical protein
MNIYKFDEFVNESKKEKTDFVKKFQKQVDEVNEIIEKAKKDEVYAIETDSTWESVYEFEKVEISKNTLKVYYTEDYKRKKVDKINLTKDSEMNFDETRYMFSWIKKTIKKGYTADRKAKAKEEKENNK